MQQIKTKLFRLGDKLQLGFQYIRGNTHAQLKVLPGFRYCPEIKLWHIDYYIGCIESLNQQFSGQFTFITDMTEIGSLQVIQSRPQKELIIRVSLTENSDILYVKHNFHTGLFKTLQVLEGSYFDYNKKIWRLRRGKHFDYLKRAADQYGFRIEIIKEREIADIADGMKVNNQADQGLLSKLDREATEMIRIFKQELQLRNRSPRTIESYISYSGNFLRHFHGRDYSKISIQEIRDMFNDLIIKHKYSYSTLNMYISAVRGLMSSNFKRELSGIEIPRPRSGKKLPRVLTKQEIQSMIEKSYNNKHKLLITMLYSTGMRRAEIIGLKVADLDLGSNHIYIHGKGNKDRSAYISENLRKLLIPYLKARNPELYLFEGQSGGAYSETSIEKVVKNTARRAGIEKNVTPHMLRHSFATHLISSGVGIAHVQKLLGHNSVKTTMIYTHIADNDLQNLPNPLDDMII